ncbi:MAG TPA: hypothetical protein VMU04_12915 [Candidatus Acidoferrum sp.]|nr:hypothetical protein [Candidatus Acidoferrum sp.]
MIRSNGQARYLESRFCFLLKNGNLCAKSGFIPESQNRARAALITNSGVPEQETAAAAGYYAKMNTR